MKIPSLIGLAWVMALSIPQAAGAQCVTVDPAVVPDLRINPLDASGETQSMQPVTLRFRRIGVGQAPIAVAYQIVDEDSTIQSRIGMSAGPQVEWRSADSAREIGVSRNEAYALLRSAIVTLAPNETSKDADIRLFLRNLREDLPAGVYREQFTLRYWCGEPDRSAPSEIPGILSVNALVPNVLSASVSGGSTHGEIDFMDFSTRSRSLSIFVRSTGRYSVSARSQNDGAMVRTGRRSEDPTDRIAYEVQVGNRLLPLAAGNGFTNMRAGLEGLQIPLDIKVEDVSGKRAGAYSDTLVLTLAPVS